MPAAQGAGNRLCWCDRAPAWLVREGLGGCSRCSLSPLSYTPAVKHQYFGDVNDYRKYGLLRSLIQSSKLSLGVCWLLTPSDSGTDGEFRRYLEEPIRWRAYDPDLYDRLQRLRQPDARRDIAHAGTWQLLPRAKYFNRTLRDVRGDRQAYFEDALESLEGCSILFFDPDNGFEVPSKPMGRKNSNKYVYWHEIQTAYARGHSLVVYQHYPMHEKRIPFVQRLVAECARRLRAPLIDSYSTPHVVFFLVARPEHADNFADANSAIVDRWTGQITPLAHMTPTSQHGTQ